MTPSSTDVAEMLNANRGGFNTQLGLHFVSAAPGEIVAEIELGPEHTQPYGIVHGGVYASLVETVCSTGAALSVYQAGYSAVGLENHTSFLRASRGGKATVRATPLKTGKRTQVWQAEVADADGRVLATGRVRLIVLEEGAKAAGQTIDRDGAARS